MRDALRELLADLGFLRVEIFLEAAQPLAEAVHALERTLLRLLVEALLAVKAGAEPDRFAQRIERIDLVADGTRDLQLFSIAIP